MDLEPEDFFEDNNVVMDLNFCIGDEVFVEEDAVSSEVIVSNESGSSNGGRYNLRPTRSDWRDSKKEYGLHITVKKALGKFGTQAVASIKLELQQMIDKEVFTSLDQRNFSTEEKIKVIRSSMILKETFLPSGVLDKFKARLIAGGNIQDRLLYEDISLPTVSTTSVFLIAVIAAKEERSLITLDIGGVYHNARMIADSNVLMRLDPLITRLLVQLKPGYGRYVSDNWSVVVRLEKALYGCVKSAKLWYEYIAETLERDMRFVKNPQDRCVFNKICNDNHLTVCVYIDDLLLTSVNVAALDATLSFLTDKFRGVKYHRSELHSYLGMAFKFDVPCC